MFLSLRSLTKSLRSWLAARRGPARRRRPRGRLRLEALEDRLAPATVTNLTASASTTTYGQSVTFTAAVTADTMPAPTGAVEFLDDTTGASFGNGQLVGTVGNTTSWTFVTLPTQLQYTPGPQTIRAKFVGTGGFADSSGTLDGQTVFRATLTVTGITAQDKLYDGTTKATLNTSNVSLLGVYNGDDATLDVSGAVGTFADSSVGTNIPVTLTGMTIAGPDAGDYVLPPPILAANIELTPPSGPTALMVKDINNVTFDSTPSPNTSTALPVDVDGTYYFPARAGASLTVSLWKSDGTAAGTSMVTDIDVSDLTPVGNTLYFDGNDGISGGELWKTDGTAAGTVMVKDIYPGSTGSDPGELTAVGNIVYFVATTPSFGSELWRSDGTATGTYLVKDINPGPADSNIANLTNCNGVLFFSANDGVHGTELWRSDGTAADTRLVKDITPAAPLPVYSIS